MSEDFKIKIDSELDLSDAEKKIKDFENKKHKVKVEADIPDLDKELGKKKPKDIEVGTKVTGAENVGKLKKDIDNTKKSADGLKDSFKSISKIGLQIDLFREIKEQALEAVKAVKQIDDAILDLQMATDSSYNSVRQMMSNYNDMAKQLGATTTEISAGASDWLRQGKTISETNKLLTDSMVLSKVANIDSATSTEQLTAMMKGYKKTAEEVSGINDSLTSIDLAAAVDAKGLAEATSRVAASAELAGVSLNKLLGYEAAVGEASQESMSVIGNSFKTIFQRMSDIKAGNLEFIDEDGTIETISDVELVLKNAGIQLRDSANDFRSFDVVLDETAAKWENFSSVQKAAISKAFAGSRQMNRFQLLMENYNKALEYEKIANNSEGTAMRKFEENYINSLEAKQKSLQASFESLAINTISRDSYAGVVEATQALIEFLNQTNLVKGALAGLAVGGITKGFLTITTGITKAAMHMQNFQKSLDLLKLGNIDTNGIQQLGSYIEGLSNSQLKAVLSSEQLTAAQRIQILQASGMSKASAEATLATMGLSAANTTATGTTLSLSTALKGLFSTLLSNPIMLVGMAVTAGVSIWSSYKQSVEEALSSARNAGQSFQENTSSLNSQIAKVHELKSALASGALSEQESANAKSQLLDIQNQLISTYGEQARGIDLVNGELQKEIGLMNELAMEDANKYLNENKSGIDKATSEMEKKRHYYLGDFSTISDSDATKELEKLVDKYKELGVATKMEDGVATITFDGDATKAKAVINDFLTDIRRVAELTGDEHGLLNLIEGSASKGLDEASKIVDEYSEIYESALKADMITKGYDADSPLSIYNEYGEAIEDYNKALSSGDTSQIEKAKNSFDNVKTSVDKVLKTYPEYKNLFDEVGSSLDENAIKIREFRDSLSVGDYKPVLNELKKMKDIDLKSMNFTDDVSSNAEKSLEEVVNKAIELGIVSDDSAESIATVVDLLVDMGLTGTQSTEALNQSFEKANTSIQESMSNMDKIKGIMAESTSGAGISADYVKAFRDMFGKDAETALERTANGYHINKEALADLQKQQEEMTETDYLNALNEQFTALRDVEAQLATAQLFERDTSGLEASRNEILDNISTLEELQYQYSAATSAYQQWQDAMSGGEEGDMYDSIFNNIKEAKELYNDNLVGTNKFREFTDLISNKDLSNASTEQIVSAYEEAIPKIRRYFTEGQEGAERFLQDVHNLNSEWASLNDDGNWEINFGTNNDQEIADKLGIDVEAVQSILRKLTDYGFDINLDQPIASMEELKSQAEQAKESLGDMEVDLNVDTFAEVDNEIARVQAYIQNLNNSEIAPDVRADKLEEANSILEYLINRKQELGQSENIDVSIDVDETELNNGYAVLAELKSNLQNLQGYVGLDYHVFQAGVESCIAQIESMSPEIKLALGIQNMSMDQIKSGLMNGSIKIPVNADTTKAKSDVQAVENQTINQKNFTVTANTGQATMALAGVRSSLASIKSKTVTVTVNKVENNSGGSKLSGTAHLFGTAYASGNWSNPKTQTALVGERGREIVVNPHTGNWYTVGENGAEFAKIPQGAIVFNDVQSEALLKNGRINGRGKALMSGTAYSSGSGSFGGRKPKPTTSNKKPKPSTSNKKPSTQKKSSTSKKTTSKSKTKSSAEKAEKATEEVLDWIKTLLERVARQTEIAVDAIDNAIGLANKQTATANAISKVQAEIAKNQEAKNAYMNKANSLGLSSDYVNKIQNGSLNIETITDENLKEKISDYKEYYENALDCEDTIRDLKEQEEELNQQRLENIEEWHDAMVDINKAMIDVSDAKQELNEKLGTAINLEVNTNELKNAVKAQEATYNQLMQKLSDYQAEFNKQVSSGAIKKDSEAWLEGQKNIQEFTSEVFEASAELIEFQDKLRQLEYDTLQNLIDGFERTVSKLDAYADLLEARDEVVPESIYQEQLDSNNAQIKANKELRDKKLKEQGLYDVNSTRYQELAEEIADIDEETLGLSEDNEKLKDSIFELRFTPIDEALEGYQKLRDEIDSFYDLLNEDAFFDKKGEITEDGLAGLALIQQGMAIAKKEIADYTTGLNKLQESLDNGVISQKEFDEKSQEYTENLQDSVHVLKNYQDQINDLYLTQINAEVDALDDVIDKRKEALRRKEEYYNFDKKIKKQTKDRDMILAQVRALEGVNNSAAAAERKRLEQELKDAEEELNESKREHALDMQEQGYDKTSEEMHDMLEKVEYDLAHSLEKQQQVLESYLSKVVGNFQTSFDKINSIIGNTGWVGSNGFNQNQSELGTQQGAQNQHNNATQSQSEANKKPSGSASGTVTDKIDSNDDFNNKVENDIMQKPNTDNRPVAELKASPTSVNLEEGQITSIKTTIRPNDAKNKTLSWKSSNTNVATASNGTISAVKAGSCNVTVSTTDGSGLSVVIKVSVRKKPEPPKPPTKPNKPTGTGDGIPQIGDRVTFVDGRYYYDSEGKRPAGSKYRGKSVYITSINKRSWATKPYHISTGKKLGSGDLGWLNLNQLKGYKNGTNPLGVRKAQKAWTQEHGQSEIIYRKSDGAILTNLNRGDAVYNNRISKNLYELGKYSPEQLMSNVRIGIIDPSEVLGGRMGIPARDGGFGNVSVGDTKVYINVEGNITEDALPGFEERLKKATPKIVTPIVTKHLYTEARKTGMR